MWWGNRGRNVYQVVIWQEETSLGGGRFSDEKNHETFRLSPVSPVSPAAPAPADGGPDGPTIEVAPVHPGSISRVVSGVRFASQPPTH